MGCEWACGSIMCKTVGLQVHELRKHERVFVILHSM